MDVMSASQSGLYSHHCLLGHAQIQAYQMLASDFSNSLKEISQFVLAAKCDELGSINREGEISPSIEASLLAIDEDSSFVINGTEIQQNRLISPRRRYGEGCGEPRI